MDIGSVERRRERRAPAGGRQCTAPARPVEVIDAVGAGDSFNAQATPGNCVDTSAPVGNASRDDQDQ
jgi:hypothetical protein